MNSSPWLSPYTRGYSPRMGATTAVRDIVPVDTGVFPPLNIHRTIHARCPRTHGGIPWIWSSGRWAAALSPYTRGYSLGPHQPLQSTAVVPVHTGVFRKPRACLVAVDRCPRTHGGIPWRINPAGPTSYCPREHGGIPLVVHCHYQAVSLSPCTRGYSVRSDLHPRPEVVVPVRTGVFRTQDAPAPLFPGCPRVHEGIPALSALHRPKPTLYRTRGDIPDLFSNSTSGKLLDQYLRGYTLRIPIIKPVRDD